MYRQMSARKPTIVLFQAGNFAAASHNTLGTKGPKLCAPRYLGTYVIPNGYLNKLKKVRTWYLKSPPLNFGKFSDLKLNI
jgi:hypothetical protein